MELARVFLLGALFLIAFMLWNAWQNEYPPNSQEIGSGNFIKKQLVNNKEVKLPVSLTETIVPIKNTQQRFIHVKTDVLDVWIDTLGGNIVKANLLQYPQHPNQVSSSPFQLLSPDAANYYVAQSGLVLSGKKQVFQYSSHKNNYSLDPGQTELKVNLICNTCGKAQIQKQFTFKKMII